MDQSSNAHQKSSNAITEWVWYDGTDALFEGEAVCYNTDYGTAANRDGRRCNRVERPSTANNRAFAGVAARDYAAGAGKLIEINVPGSKGVNVALGVDTVIDTGLLVFQVGGGSAAGRFVKTGFTGRGAIIPRQTVTAVLEASMTGAWSLATDGKTLTVVATAGLAAGDTVVLLGGKDEGSSKAIIPGKYTIASITSATVLVLSASAVGATPTGALTCTGYAYTGNPKCQADLLTGEESGGAEFVDPPATGGAAVMSFMVGGFTYVCGGLTVGTAVANGALAQAAIYGLKKAFAGLGTLTTNGVTVTPATNGLMVDGSTALALITIDAAAEVIVLEWNCIWVCKGLVGATAA